MTNAIIYIRVSDPSQIDNISFQVQREACEKYAKEQEWKIIKEFKEEGESAKLADRTKLKELIEYCRVNKGKIQVCLVYKIDRFARNQVDHYAIKARLLEYGISLRSATEPVDDTPIGKVIEGLFAAVAQLDNDIKSQRVKAAMKNWVLNGRWVWGAKFGYLNKKDATDHAINPIDSIKGPIVTELFEKFSTGLYTYNNLADELDKRGIKGKLGGKIHPQNIERILTDKFYIGIIELYGEEVKGLFHEPLTDETTYYKCQAVIAKRSNNTNKPRHTENEDFFLRGLLLCPDCGKKMTAAWCAGRSNKHPYYYCKQNGCPLKSKSYKRKDIEDDFLNLLTMIKPKDESLSLFKEVFLRFYEKRLNELEGDSLRIKAELENLEKEKKRIIEMGKKNQLTEEEYNEEISQVRDKIALANLNLNESKTDISEVELCLNYGQNFIRTAALVWFDAPPLWKIKYQTMIFPNGVKYAFDEISNHDLALPFRLNRQFEESKNDSVAGAGVEPTSGDYEPPEMPFLYPAIYV